MSQTGPPCHRDVVTYSLYSRDGCYERVVVGDVAPHFDESRDGSEEAAKNADLDLRQRGRGRVSR